MLIFQIFSMIVFFLGVYFLIAFCVVLILSNFPRMPVDDIPDWGVTKEYRVPTINRKKTMECWVVYPDFLKGEENEELLKKNPAIILMHGWGRSRGRMVSRARMYGEKNGYTTILISARDHGNSDKERTGMSIVRFSQDVESCVDWWGKPVSICGHSLGAGAALIVASRNNLVQAVIAESPPFAFPSGLKYVYKPALKWFNSFFLPGITLITLIKFWRYSREDYSPYDAASRIKVPTLIIHGKKDEIFPYNYSEVFQKTIEKCKVWIVDKATHYDIENHPDYEKHAINFLKSTTAES